MNANCSFEQFPSLSDGPYPVAVKCAQLLNQIVWDGSKGRKPSLYTSN